MLKSLNFWLFLVVIICGVSLLIASGISLPNLAVEQEIAVPVAPNWRTGSDDAPIHVKILNGTSHSGLAREFSLLVSAKGCVVETIGNAPGTWPESLLVNRRLELQTSRELAHQLGGMDVIRQWDERLTEDAVIVLGEDFEKVRAALQE